MPDLVRRLSVPPLAGLEGQKCRALGGGGVAVWIPHSFPLLLKLPCREDHPRARPTSLSGRSTVPGATLTGILSPVQCCLRWQNFFAGSAPRRIWGFLPSGSTAPCCLRYLGSNSLLSLLILCFGIFFALSA